jgi:hypothetical protein
MFAHVLGRMSKVLNHRYLSYIACILFVFGSEVRTQVDPPSIEILSPADGTTIQASDSKDLKVHVKVIGMSIPEEGYGDIYLNDQLIGSTPQNEVIYVIDGARTIPTGDHRLAVILFDTSDEPMGVEQHSFFRFVGEEYVNEHIQTESRREGDEDEQGRFVSLDKRAPNEPGPSKADHSRRKEPSESNEGKKPKAGGLNAIRAKPTEWSTSCIINARKTTVSGDISSTTSVPTSIGSISRS